MFLISSWDFSDTLRYFYMRGSRGGGVRNPPPPRNFQSLITADLREKKKLVIFHIWALPQLYVKTESIHKITIK